MVAILQQQASGQIRAQIVRVHGLSEATSYAWESKYAGASVAELTQLNHLEEENYKLKQVFANLSLKTRYIVPECNGVTFGQAIQQKLWDKYFVAAPAQLRQYDVVSSVVRKASKR